ncbi:MAG TPA: glycosyltransferase family 4 protein [Alphaproteobacteria bacterium]|jgi:glycosyltransferase involved in cell wall biosynthesis
MSGRRVGVFHAGTQHSWQTALAFQESGQLGWYATSVFYNPRKWPYRIEGFMPGPLGRKLNREFRRRGTPLLDLGLVRTFGVHEWVESVARRLNMHGLADLANVRGNVAFGKDVIRLLQREPVDVVWGYNNSSVEVFRWAKRRGIACVLDQTIGHPRALNEVMLAEQARHPEFFLRAFRPFDAAWIAQQDEEVALADKVVVGCEFCAQTMIDNGCPPEKLTIVPYGYDETAFSAVRPARARRDGPARFLFVGTVDPRKGVQYLLKAFEAIPAAEASLTLIGKLAIPAATFERFRGRVTHVGQLPRHEIAARFAEADCFVFPSLFEGGGIVLYEALGSGLGVIQSGASAIVVENGRNGVLLDKISIDGVTQAIRDAAARPDLLARWQDESWQLRGSHGWDRYREQLRGLIP